MGDRTEAIGASVTVHRCLCTKPHRAKCGDFGVAGAEIRALAGVGTDIDD